MEYILFRVLRLVEREIEMYEQLYESLCDQNEKINQEDVIDSFANIFDQQEMLNTISSIEQDIKEEIAELSEITKIKIRKSEISLIVHVLKNKYPKLCDLFVKMSKNIDELLCKIDRINKQNMVLFQHNKNLWKDILPITESWNEFKPMWEITDKSAKLNNQTN